MLQSTTTPTVSPGFQTGSVVPGQVSPVQAGSIVALPPGSIVNVSVGGKLVPVKTVSAPGVAQTTMLPPPVLPGSIVQSPFATTTTSVVQRTSIQPTTVPFSTQSVSVPVPMQSTLVQNQTVEGNPTPTVKTLPPKIVKNQLPPQYKTVTLPPKVVQTRLAPIGPAPTPQLQLPNQSVTLPTTSIVNPPLTTTTTSIQTSPGVLPLGTQYATSSLNPVTLPFRTSSVNATYGTTSVGPLTAPLASSSIANVGFGTPVLTSTTTPAFRGNVGYGTSSAFVNGANPVGGNVGFGTSVVQGASPIVASTSLPTTL